MLSFKQKRYLRKRKKEREEAIIGASSEFKKEEEDAKFVEWEERDKKINFF
jgi:hypothetical protein